MKRTISFWRAFFAQPTACNPVHIVMQFYEIDQKNREGVGGLEWNLEGVI